MNIYLIRHPKVKLDKSYCYGQSDVGIDDSLEIVKDNLLNHLLNENVLSDCIIYSSSLQRCLSIAQQFSKNVFIEQDLMEMNFGEWEMKKWSEIPNNELTTWMNDFVNVNTPNGESYITLYNRVVKKVLELMSNHAGKNLIIFTHAGPIRAIVSHFLNLPLENSFKFQIDYNSISKIIVKNELVSIAYINHYFPTLLK